MERWESLLEGYPEGSDLRFFTKTIQEAGVVIKEDLAPFETDWIINTLLYKPINLISTVRDKRNDELWSKAIGDTFKLLSDIVSKHYVNIEKYVEDVVSLCHLPFDPQTRKQALLCLTQITIVSSHGAIHVHKHIASLEESSNCKAALALLIGTICEYHPETVANDINKIWRIYLNLLDSNKNTGTITQSLLQGILGLFKHFGCDLPMAEINMFYDKMVNDYITRTRCEDACLKILTDHSNIFREKIMKDTKTRQYLCMMLYDSATAIVASAVASVYNALCGPMLKEQILKIAKEELLHLVQSNRTLVKYTALRIIHNMKRNYDIHILDEQTDVQTLEFELRNDVVTYDIAEAVSYCIESKLPNSDKLLQTAILFYTNLPSSRRKEIVVHGILNCEPELRTAIINFLISESTVNLETLLNHKTIWNDIFDTNNGKDLTVMDKSKYVFEDVMNYVAFVLESFLDNSEIQKEKITTTLHLTTQILQYQSSDQYVIDHCAILMELLVDLYDLIDDVSIISCVRAASEFIVQFPGLKDFYKNIRIDRCKDESSLCETCLAIIHATNEATDVASVLLALQIIFSRYDVPPSTLSKSLEKFEYILKTDYLKENLDEALVNNIIQLIENMRNRNDFSGKDARILNKDIIMFLGKYSKRNDLNNNIDSNNLSISKLMSNFNLNLPNPQEGSNYKINLRNLLHLSLELEDPDSLQTLLVILCANASLTLYLVLPNVLLAMSRVYARGAISTPKVILEAANINVCEEFCKGILKYISQERSPGVRKMLSDVLETALKTQEELIPMVADETIMMMKNNDVITKNGGLNITEVIISVLKENNSLTKKLVPNILISISKTFQIGSKDAFDVASKHFMEKIELFEQATLKNIIEDLFKVLLSDYTSKPTERDIKMLPYNKNMLNVVSDSERRIFKINVEAIVDFLKKIFDNKKYDFAKLFDMFLDIRCWTVTTENLLSTVTLLSKKFNFDISSQREILTNEKCSIINMVYAIGGGYNYVFEMEIMLKFLEEYHTILLELEYEQTIKHVGEIIEKIEPYCVKKLHKNLESCLTIYVSKCKFRLMKYFERWLRNLKIDNITTCIEKEKFLKIDSEKVSALKTMLHVFKYEPTLTAVKTSVRNWPKILLNFYARDYITNYLKPKMSYLTDLMTVSIGMSTLTDVKVLLLEGSNLPGLPGEKIGVRFGRFFIKVIYDVLVKKPFILLDSDMEVCCVLIEDIVKNTLLKKRSDEEYDDVLELVDKLWPTYSKYSSFNQKQSLLQDLNNFPKKLTLESNPLQWVTGVITSEGSREEKARLIGVLPGGDCFSAIYRSYSSHLPIRLSEMSTNVQASFRALIDALAITGDITVLDILMSLSDGDETKGWWDEALDSCMASLATRGTPELCKAAYTQCGSSVSLGSCRRVLVPLLRYATSSFCEQFYSTILKDLLSFKEVKNITSDYIYLKTVTDYTRRLMLLRVLFEKLPTPTLESPSSTLYCQIEPQVSWYAVREACKLCVTLTEKVTVPDSDSLTVSYRSFLYENYACLSAAICKRKPALKMYNNVLDVKVWDRLIDQDKVYDIRIRNQWNTRTTRQTVSIAIENTELKNKTIRTGTLRTKMFLRTLSESPLLYDLIDDGATEEYQTLQLADSPLNDTYTAGTMTALICHMTTLEGEGWVDKIVGGVRVGMKNTRWMLAQIICNCKSELKSKASALRPALLELITTTPIETNGKMILNGLHVDIIETLIHWEDDSPTKSEDLNTTFKLFITTILEFRKYVSLYRTLIDTLKKFLNIYSTVLDVVWDVFDGYMEDQDTSKTIEVLYIISKSKIQIDNLLPILIKKIENKQYYQLPKTAELFGVAIANNNDRQYLVRFRKVLDHLRKTSAGDYVKMLYYSQIGYPEICDEYNFRQITDLTPKIVGPEKSKCIAILSNYMSNCNINGNTKEIYNSIEFPEIIKSDNTEGMKLIQNGLQYMQDGGKRQVIAITLEYCKHVLVKVRKSAFEVILAGLDDLFNSAMLPPSTKRAKLATTQLIKYIESSDIYINTIFNAIALGVCDKDAAIAALIRNGVNKYLDCNDMGIRFTECSLICIYLPLIHNVKSENLSVCVSSLLELLLSALKSNDRFKMMKLRDDPLVIRNANMSSRVLTMSSTYQGTFRGTNLTTSRRNRSIQDDNSNSPAIDVQVTYGNILDTFLKFAKQNPQASQALCLELVKAIPGIEQGALIAKCLSTILNKDMNVLTPFIVQLSTLFIEDLCKIDGIQEILKNLKTSSINSEAELIMKCLYNDIKLRCSGDEQFVMGFDDGEESEVMMMDDETEFSVEDLQLAFKKLSNWELLTMKQKRNVINSGLPILWTGKDNFKKHLDDFNVTSTQNWFEKMTCAYKQTNKEDTIKWMRQLEQYPRKYFDVSAITEAISWLNGDEDDLSHLVCDIQSGDCLAQWSARLMIRTAHANTITAYDTKQTAISRSRSHELLYCQRANEMAIPSVVLSCVKRNTGDLFESETLPWLQQKLLALRTIAIENGDQETLKKCFDSAVTYFPQFETHAKLDDYIASKKLFIMLNTDLKVFDNIELTSDEIVLVNNMIEETFDEKPNKNILNSFYEAAMIHLDSITYDLDDSDAEFGLNEILEKMAYILESMVKKGVTNYGIISIVINKMYKANEENETLEQSLVFTLMDILLGYKDDFVIEHVSKLCDIYRFKVDSERRRNKKDETKFKRYFELLCDADYSLLQYSDQLMRVLKENHDNPENTWSDIIKKIKYKIFENPYAGTDYQLLNKYQSKFDEIAVYEESNTFKTNSEKVLLNIIQQLKTKQPLSVLRLSQLCPRLAKSDFLDFPVKLLGLKDNVNVVKIDEQIPVFTDSIRRPTLLKVLLTNGQTKRYIHKSGESLASDAAAQNITRFAETLWKGKGTIVSYNVTQLSDDSGLIEYLENHERVRNLVMETCDLDGVPFISANLSDTVTVGDTEKHSIEILSSIRRPANHELILSPMQSNLNEYTQICNKVPKHSLKTAILKRSLTQNEFLNKINKFQESVATSSIITWLLGLGDRHLHNILYSSLDGAICHIDWGAICQYGSNELSPARLTGTVIAVCDRIELEAKLQQLLTILKQSKKLFAAVINMSFKYLPNIDEETKSFATAILEGKYITMDKVKKFQELSEHKKQKYQELFEKVFENFEFKDDVENQIQYLLRLSTDPRILSVIRSEWEPWV